MSNRTDIDDDAILDAVEILSSGTTSFSTLPVTNVVSGTMTLAPSAPYLGLQNGDEPVEPGDLFTLSGASAGDGGYEVATVSGNTTLTATPVPPDSTGGSVTFSHPPGASRIGVDPTAISSSSATTLQSVLEDIDAALAAGGITETQHKAVKDLVHLADTDGPMDGWVSGAEEETLPFNSPFPTSAIWYTDASHTKAIVGNFTIWSGAQIVTDKFKSYDNDGTTVLVTITDTWDYSPGFLTPKRVRTWVLGDA